MTWHTCLGHYPLQKICFFFIFSVQLLSLLWQLKVSNRLITGRLEIRKFLLSHLGYSNFIFTDSEMFIE